MWRIPDRDIYTTTTDMNKRGSGNNETRRSVNGGRVQVPVLLRAARMRLKQRTESKEGVIYTYGIDNVLLCVGGLCAKVEKARMHGMERNIPGSCHYYLQSYPLNGAFAAFVFNT